MSVEEPLGSTLTVSDREGATPRHSTESDATSRTPTCTKTTTLGHVSTSVLSGSNHLSPCPVHPPTTLLSERSSLTPHFPFLTPPARSGPSWSVSGWSFPPSGDPGSVPWDGQGERVGDATGLEGSPLPPVLFTQDPGQSYTQTHPSLPHSQTDEKTGRVSERTSHGCGKKDGHTTPTPHGEGRSVVDSVCLASSQVCRWSAQRGPTGASTSRCRRRWSPGCLILPESPNWLTSFP